MMPEWGAGCPSDNTQLWRARRQKRCMLESSLAHSCTRRSHEETCMADYGGLHWLLYNRTGKMPHCHLNITQDFCRIIAECVFGH